MWHLRNCIAFSIPDSDPVIGPNSADRRTFGGADRSSNSRSVCLSFCVAKRFSYIVTVRSTVRNSNKRAFLESECAAKCFSYSSADIGTNVGPECYPVRGSISVTNGKPDVNSVSSSKRCTESSSHSLPIRVSNCNPNIVPKQHTNCRTDSGTVSLANRRAERCAFRVANGSSNSDPHRRAHVIAYKPAHDGPNSRPIGHANSHTKCRSNDGPHRVSHGHPIRFSDWCAHRRSNRSTIVFPNFRTDRHTKR